jgi:septal ring factor EnvC (AmiA/AmiB activator)
MDPIQIGIGVVVGFIIGLIIVRVLDRRHQKIVKKLVDSRHKIERQRTQAVNDLFALRAEIEQGHYQQPMPGTATGEIDPRVQAEIANLRSLIGRADAALTAARRRRDENEAEIGRLRTVVEELQGENVINLRPAAGEGTHRAR